MHLSRGHAIELVGKANIVKNIFVRLMFLAGQEYSELMSLEVLS